MNDVVSGTALRDELRTPAWAARCYPADRVALARMLDGYALQEPPVEVPALGAIHRASGVLSPHIDYIRGGPVYGATWSLTTEALAGCDAVVVFGTDHRGSAGALTLTTQRYATPWGALPNDLDTISTVCRVLGPRALAEERHHDSEHAIELAAVWLHWALRRAGRGATLPPVTPILCGSFHCYTRQAAAGASPEDDPLLNAALESLAQSLAGRRTLVVAAADLAHVGPAFGDSAPLSDVGKRRVADHDAAILGAVAAGSAAALLDAVRWSADRTRVCGLPPTYWALRLLERLRGGVSGRLTAYAQCPADKAFGSVVSIAGALWE